MAACVLLPFPQNHKSKENCSWPLPYSPCSLGSWRGFLPTASGHHGHHPPAVGRMESGIFFYLPQPSPHLDTLPQTCSSQVPVCFQACHLHTQEPGGEMPPDRAGHPHGWIFGGAERPQLLCSQLPAHPSQHPAHLGLGHSMGQRDPEYPGDGHGELPGSEGSPQTLADLLQL